ncbi:1565_t:CDS:2 [Cetraspora pellucida]|uniref:1565_t:CDS:1 n=1 Tax=Cetraspora pellucida TaxID=1433469 RepID=A0A9N8ZPF7_9GLOM|nr:1565_t:CDS:2 [Cetraspora pellucida]
MHTTYGTYMTYGTSTYVTNVPYCRGSVPRVATPQDTKCLPTTVWALSPEDKQQLIGGYEVDFIPKNECYSYNRPKMADPFLTNVSWKIGKESTFTIDHHSSDINTIFLLPYILFSKK